MNKVIFIIPSFRGGGAERVFIDLTTIFHNRGYIVSLVALSGEGAYSDALPAYLDIKVLGVDSTSKSLFLLSKLIKETKPHIVLSALTHLNIITVLAVMLSKVKSKIVVTEHNPFSVEKKALPLVQRFLMYFLSFLTYRLASKVIAVSYGVKRSLIRGLFLKNDHIEVIYNPIAIDNIQSESRRFSHHVPPGDYIVTMGRLVSQKRQDLLIRALAKLVDDGLNIKLVILGDGPLKENLKELSVSLGIEDKVIFLGFLANPFPIISAAKAFVLSSDFEGFGNVLVEAMALGVPVISTDCLSGPREILESGKFGILTPVNDAESLAQDIKAVLVGKVSFDSNDLICRSYFFSEKQAFDAYHRLFFSLIT